MTRHLSTNVTIVSSYSMSHPLPIQSRDEDPQEMYMGCRLIKFVLGRGGGVVGMQRIDSKSLCSVLC